MIAIAFAALLAAAPAEEPDQKKVEPVRTIALKDLALPPFERGDVRKPTTLVSVEELKKAFPNEATQTALLKHVDFAKEKLLFFAWEGSGQDKHAPATYDADAKPPVATFSYAPGLTRDLRQHVALYVVPRTAEVKVESKR